MPKLKIEPFPRQSLPKHLQQYPELLASELYTYRVLRRGPARAFYRELEAKMKAKEGTDNVAFRFHDVVLWLLSAAGQGVIGNLAFAVLLEAIRKVRQPKQEIGASKIRLEGVVSRRTYNRIRRERHPGKKASRTVTPDQEERLETDYRLMVRLTRKER
jgi:hypothetical protein